MTATPGFYLDQFANIVLPGHSPWAIHPQPALGQHFNVAAVRRPPHALRLAGFRSHPNGGGWVREMRGRRDLAGLTV